VVGTQATFAYTVTNIGGDTLNGNAVAPCAGFAVVPPTFSLGAGEQTQLKVTFSPTTAGSSMCDLDVGSNGGNVQLDLSGSGVTPPVPVVPSPVSPWGLLMIAGLGFSMVWVLRMNRGRHG